MRIDNPYLLGKIFKNKQNFFFFYFKRVKSPASGKEDVQFPDSLDFENLPDFRTRRDAGRDVL